jgi:hypothetical protein
MTMYCRDGHASTTNDYCSECGLEMIAASGAAPVAASAPVRRDATLQLCPKCKTDRDDPTVPFCGVCGYNFDTGAAGNVVHDAPVTVPAPTPARAPAPPPAKPVVVTRSAATAPHIDVEISFADVASAPKGTPVKKFSFYDDESLIGRKTSGAAQTVGLDGDDYVSRRHVLIVRHGTGYVARLFDNTNGGTVNGVEMTAGVEVPIKEGDVIAIGTHTLIKVTAIR